MKQFYLLFLFSIFIISCNGQNKNQAVASKQPLQSIPPSAIKIYDHGADTFLIPEILEINVKTVSMLPLTLVRSGIKDRNGDLWFGTWEGIYRYDGKMFTVYTQKNNIVPSEQQYGPKYNRVHSILNRSYCILEDKLGRIWFTAPDGMICYDPRLKDSVVQGAHFMHYPLPTARGSKDYYPKGVNWDLNQLSAKCVVGIYEDRKGSLWFGTWGGGAYRFDGNSFTNISEKDGLCQNVVQCFYEDKSGNFWLGTRGGGMCFYDGKSYSKIKMREGNSDGHFFNILEDKKGDIWISTRREGVFRYDGKTYTNFLDTQPISGISEDKDGKLWFGSDQSGAYCYNGTSMINLSTKDGLCGNSVWFILQDKNGDHWFGTRDGLCFYDGKKFSSYNEKAN